MKLLFAATTLALATTAFAQTSPEAPYDIGNYLPAYLNNSIKLLPGSLFTRYQVAVAPAFGAVQTTGPVNQPFVAIAIDIDVTVNASQPSNRTEFLHYFQPNLYAANGTAGNLTLNSSGANATSIVGATWIVPQPAEGPPHNYNLYLFKQPANFTLPPNLTRFNQPPADNLLARAYFNITQFAAQTGLGQPIAANYLRVINGTAAQISSYQSQTATSGVAFSSGFTYSTFATGAANTTSSGGTSTSSGASASVTMSPSGSMTTSASTPTSSASSAGESSDMSVLAVKAVCMAVAATLPWIW